MEIQNAILLVMLIGIAAYVLINKNKIFSKSNENTNSIENEKKLEEELKNRAHILSKIENFLKASEFLEPIAKWREEHIYKYILNNGCLYEFDEIMAAGNQRIGMDEDFLCFKQMIYKRVNNPQEFFEKFKRLKTNDKEISTEKELNLSI